MVQAKYSNSSNYVTISDTISWSSNNSNIATVESGNRLKSGNIYGTTQITASYKGKTATCTVTVVKLSQLLESISIKPTECHNKRSQHLLQWNTHSKRPNTKDVADPTDVTNSVTWSSNKAT